MTKDELKRIDDQGLAAWDKHDGAAFVSLLADDFVWYDWATPEPMRDKQAARAYFDSWMTAFPDMHTRRVSQIVGDDAVASELEFTGTNTGPMNMGGQSIPATQKKVTGHGDYFARIRDGKIVEFRTHPDVAGLMMQMGMMPTMH
jgi:steroid delta-isomerase-like uncharacterized protein